MKILLDTYAFIWFINGDKNLSSRAENAILNPDNSKYISIASIWELSIKISLNKLKIIYPFKEVFNQIAKNGFEILPISFDHTLLISQLDFHHRDPFDRLIIAQAINGNMVIISKDSIFYKYNVELIW